MKRTDDADAREQDDEDEGDQQPDGIHILILSPPRATARMRNLDRAVNQTLQLTRP